VTHDVTTFGPIRIKANVHPQRYDGELAAFANTEFFVNLAALLRTNYYNLVCRRSRQKFFYADKDARLPTSVVAVKDVAVIRVHEAASAWPAKQDGRRPPSVEKTGNSANR